MKKTLIGFTIAGAMLMGGCGAGSNETPQSCRDAIRYADQGIGLAAQALDSNNRFLQAITSNDSAGAQQAYSDLERVSSEIKAVSPKYKEAKSSCLNN